jgi:hypothetical protein
MLTIDQLMLTIEQLKLTFEQLMLNIEQLMLTIHLGICYCYTIYTTIPPTIHQLYIHFTHTYVHPYNVSPVTFTVYESEMV